MLSSERRQATPYAVPSRVRGVLFEIGLLALSALLFALSFPSFLSSWGWFPLGFVALGPLFFVIHRAPWPRVPLYGLFTGYATYALFNFWLAIFHPLTIFIVPPLYAFIYVGLFLVLKAASVTFPRWGFRAPRPSR